MDHSNHGRGHIDTGPEETDCACRGTVAQFDCGSQGCGFCRAGPNDETVKAVVTELNRMIGDIEADGIADALTWATGNGPPPRLVRVAFNRLEATKTQGELL